MLKIGMSKCNYMLNILTILKQFILCAKGRILLVNWLNNVLKHKKKIEEQANPKKINKVPVSSSHL